MTRENKFDFAFLRRRESLWVLLLFVLLTAFAARNVLADLNGVIIGRDNDVYINPWADWWTIKALSDSTISLWHSDFMYYPIGADLVYHSFSHLNTAVSIALRPLVGILPAYNLTILLNFVLTGWSMYHLGKYVTGSSIAGILAGIVFAFNSHNLYQSAHPVLISLWCFPWMTLYFLRALRENSITLALVAAVFVFLGAATSTVLVILMIFWMALLVLYLFFTKELLWQHWRLLLVFTITSGITILPLAFPLLKDAIVGSNSSFMIDTYQSVSTDMATLYIPHWYAWLIRGMYIGIMPFFLMMLAVGRQRVPSRLWLLLAIVAYLFSIGPYPTNFGYKYSFVLPWVLPIAPVLRNMYRMTILLSLGLAMVTAYGWLGLKQSFGTATRWVGATAVFVGAAIFLEYTAVPFPTTPAIVSEFYTEYMQNVPDDVVVAILPTGRQQDKRYMYYQTLHEHPMTGGVISRAGEDVFQFINGNSLLRAGAVNETPVLFPQDATAALHQLAEANVGFLIIDKALLNEAYREETSLLDIEDWRNLMPVTPIYEDDLLLVFPTAPEFKP